MKRINRAGLVLAVLPIVACARWRPNLLLVTFDTTRWDHVGYATGTRDLTPTLDELAARGTWFSTCLTTQPLTMPAHTSILTGLEPYHHGVRNNGTYIVPSDVETLAETLQARGWATHAIVSAFVLDSQFGLAQGFDGYDDDLSGGPKQKMFMFKELKATQTAAKAVRWLKEERPKEKPFYLWVHFFDPHGDYEPPEDVATLFPGDPYSGEIHYADRELGRVISALKDSGAGDDTVVVFVSDHGDGLGEHGEKTHGIFIYESTTRVPLVLAGPGVPPGRRVDALARTIDIVPTLLELLRVRPQAPVDGRSLRPLWQGRSEQRTAYLETWTPRENFGWAELRGARSAQTKVIVAPRQEAYDLAADPAEAHDLLAGGGTAPAGALSLFATLREIASFDPINTGAQKQGALDQETREKLRSLGYVWASPAESDAPRPDPKDRIAYWEGFQAAQGLIRRGDYPTAITEIRKLLAVDPENVVAMGSLANALVHMHERDEALAIFRRMMALDPHRETPYLGAARLLSEAGKADEAAALVEQVIRMQPDNPEGYTALGDVDLGKNDYSHAEQWFRKALAIDPHSSLAISGLGNCLNRAGRTQEARKVLADGYKRDPTSHALAYNLAVVCERLGDRQAALKLYQAALRLEPDHSMTWNNLGSLLDKAGKREDAIRLIAKAHDLDPDNVEATYNLGVLLLLGGKAHDALPLLEQAHRARPDLPQAAVFHARALEAVGRGDDALAAWRAMAAAQPPAWLQVARLELEAGRAAAARQALDEGVRRGGEPVRQAALKMPKLAALLRPSP